MTRILGMSEKEIERIKIMVMVEEKRITQKEAAQQMGISERQTRRVLRKYRKEGEEGLISKRRGKASNNQMKRDKKREILGLLQTKYEGFGPTLASEKLWENEAIAVSKETIRKILIEEGCHKPKIKKKEKEHPLRKRKGSVGEMVQIDGSYHAWLENRAEKQCLILFVDDASSQILAGRFVPRESFAAYAELCKDYFQEKGLPKAFYSDRFSVFRVNAKNVTTTDSITQFSRALSELGVNLICANSPQAKGRVERANKTLQDRLVKEMRLAGIHNYEQANQFLPIYFAAHNQKFAVQPRSSVDFHKALPAHFDLDHIFTMRFKRIISKNLQVQFNNKIYQIVSDRPSYSLKKREIVVAQYPDGRLSFLLNDSPLKATLFHQQPKQAQIVSSKDLQDRKPYVPPQDHPWRSYGKMLNGNPLPSSN